ncbi:hypothetical protein GGX14DRAFT_367635 [Mycena pura]|uniref:Uncharacterized protein n=1 Tax=Mycena pura TaxID=153505 RepID=A0AAD6V8Q6_9AGAR|nr:hypothetical protein GGX14DRAFT_367635 [Mycena pura]
MTLKEIWQTLKDYFGDGFVQGTAPLRFNVHLCETNRALNNENVHIGVHIDENAMPLFDSLGEVAKPPCTCEHLAALCRHIDELNEVSAEETCEYTMRDTLQWWLHWHGSLDRQDFWKHLYVAFGTIPDDLLIPPEHLLDGTFRFLGHTGQDLSAGLLAEGVSPEDVLYLDMCLLRQYFVQYLEKVDPGDIMWNMLLEKTHVMLQWRILTAATTPCGVVLLLARGIPLHHNDNVQGQKWIEDEALEMAGYGDALSLDLAKEALGILKGEPTESVTGENRDQLKAELRWTYARSISHLDTLENAKYLRRYATSGFHFVLFNERYRERLSLKRVKMTPPMRELITAYTVGTSIPEKNVV